MLTNPWLYCAVLGQQGELHDAARLRLERLQCANCIVCVRKNRPDRAILLRTFMFMGFQLLAPTSAILPRELANPEYIFLHYNMQ
ncbi:unnamed protein product [Plutella xylostella]|uniref:Ornithine decarboxylase antizyme n=1 Tax=Plutella xylostella TaxID=51655 RepID=A0A8S4G1S7_PLUXY|nr:unnamed protein product [Plutella xylostella]